MSNPVQGEILISKKLFEEWLKILEDCVDDPMEEDPQTTIGKVIRGMKTQIK